MLMATKLLKYITERAELLTIQINDVIEKTIYYLNSGLVEERGSCYVHASKLSHQHTARICEIDKL
jgi:hypothetical protein